MPDRPGMPKRTAKRIPAKAAAHRRVAARREQASAGDPLINDVIAYLGGKRIFKTVPRSRSDVHDLIVNGMPGHAVTVVVERARHLNREKIATALGVSTRTIQRRSEKPASALSPEQGDRTWKFSELMVRAAEILGGEEQAEKWFDSPAMGLAQRKPIDLLATSVGASLVEQLLGRMEYGVYT